jgi:hypothetical protein
VRERVPPLRVAGRDPAAHGHGTVEATRRPIHRLDAGPQPLRLGQRLVAVRVRQDDDELIVACAPQGVSGADIGRERRRHPCDNLIPDGESVTVVPILQPVYIEHDHGEWSAHAHRTLPRRRQPLRDGTPRGKIRQRVEIVRGRPEMRLFLRLVLLSIRR